MPYRFDAVLHQYLSRILTACEVYYVYSWFINYNFHSFTKQNVSMVTDLALRLCVPSCLANQFETYHEVAASHTKSQPWSFNSS